ncbi:MAG: phage tail family protein [Dehalococcoidia bacterium]|nr:phage tail family protein [Dehalococcoidia bacterium]
MPYSIDRFGATYATAEELPRYDGVQPQGAGPVESSQVKLVGGAYYDARGDDTALPPAEEITVRGDWVAASDAAMQTKLAALRALRGEKSKLWRTTAAGTSHWRWARCLEVDSDLEPGSPSMATIKLAFELDAEPWYGTSVYNSIVLGTSPVLATIANAGNAIARGITVTVHPATTPITAIHLENLTTGNVSKIKYAGTIAATQALVIDCSAKSVMNNGTGSYVNLTLESAHTIAEWLRLAPGDNSIRITATGGAVTSTIGVLFYEAHA